MSVTVINLNSKGNELWKFVGSRLSSNVLMRYMSMNFKIISFINIRSVFASNTSMHGIDLLVKC